MIVDALPYFCALIMSKMGKLQRFEEMKRFDHVIQPAWDEAFHHDHPLKGHWVDAFFKRDGALVLELACGKGEYSVGMAGIYPVKNFLGIDIKGARIWRGARTALDNKISNVGFLRTRIDFITNFFSRGEVDEIWIIFPDPQPGKRRARKRLTHPIFLNRYKQILRKDGLIHLKTDNNALYAFTKEVIDEEGYRLICDCPDVYGKNLSVSLPEQVRGIRTFYEQMFTAEGASIHYLGFKLCNDA